MCTTTTSTILLWLFVILLLSYVYVVNLWTCDGELLRFAHCSHCLWNAGAPLAGNAGFICPLSRSVSTKQSGRLHNLCATICVVNQTSYFSPSYASRHQTPLWRRQRIYSVQFPQTAQSLLPRSSPSFVRSFVNTALLMAQITPHNPRLQVAHSDYWVQACRRRVATRTQCDFYPQ